MSPFDRDVCEYEGESAVINFWHCFPRAVIIKRCYKETVTLIVELCGRCGVWQWYGNEHCWLLRMQRHRTKCFCYDGRVRVCRRSFHWFRILTLPCTRNKACQRSSSIHTIHTSSSSTMRKREVKLISDQSSSPESCTQVYHVIKLILLA